MRNTKSKMSAVVLLLVFFFFVQNAHSELCKVQLDCPGNWDNDTIQVDKSVVALTNSMLHCAPDSIIEGLEPFFGDTISVFFIIDHSGSMSINDSTALRYAIVNDLIDSIYKKSPASEVGLAVFSNQLLHSYQDDTFFKQLDPAYHDSYVPLTVLNTTIGSMGAVEKIKWSIELTDDPVPNIIDENRQLVNGNYSPTGRHNARIPNVSPGYTGTTDISLAFEAARQAFLTSTRPKNRQFIIFLSDGEAQEVDLERVDRINDYLTGEGLPTTYTAYFITPNKTIPQAMMTMTANIQKNGYSDNNASSEIWKTQNSKTDLFQKLFTGLQVGTSLKHYFSTPVSLSINGQTTNNFDSTMAFFSGSIPLTGEYTELTVNYTYHWNAPLNTNATRNFTFTIHRGGSSELEPVECWEQGILAFYYKDSLIAQKIGAKQDTLEVRFTPPQNTGSDTVKIVIRNAAGDDSLVLDGVWKTSYYSAVFSREYADPKNDAILQNHFSDSLIATYVNPELPLDIVRLAVKVAEPRDIAVSSAFYLDTNANGIPDLLRVVQGTDKFTAEEVALIKQSVTLITNRALPISNVVSAEQGFDILLDETNAGAAEINTSLFASETLHIDRVPNLPNGGECPLTNIAIQDSMAPVIVNAHYYRSISDPSSDKIVVTFSEKPDSIASQTPFFVKFARGAQFSLSVTPEKADSPVITFSVSPQQINRPIEGDTIWINHAAGLADTIGNDQDNSSNVRRILDYSIIYKITNAIYFDNNSDGLIDRVQVVMDSVPTSELLDAIYENLVLPSHRSFSYSRTSMVPNQTGFDIYVQQPSSTVPSTSTDSRDVLTIPYTESDDNKVLFPSTVPIIDSVAPVIVSVKFVAGPINSDQRKDTLLVTFSEPIAVPESSKPFIFYDPVTKVNYTMTVRFAGEKSPVEKIFIVDGINGKEFPDDRDSVSINPQAAIKDLSLNIQDKENRWAPLSVSAQKPKFIVTISPNPYIHGQSFIPASVKKYYNVNVNEGILILVEPELKSIGTKAVRGTIVIYDAVGNLVYSSENVGSVQNTKGIAFVWNCKNKNGRNVGPGVYLAEIKFQDEDGNKKELKGKIGIKRLESEK